MSPFPVVVYGDSLLMSSVFVTLHKYAELKLLQVTPDSVLAQETLDAMRAGVLICELDTNAAQGITDFLFTHPNVTVIGLRFEEGRAMTLVCQEHSLQTTTALVQIIERELSVCAGRSLAIEKGGSIS